MHTLSKILLAPFFLIASWFHPAPVVAPVPYTPAPAESVAPEASLGASLPQGVAVFETSLQSAVTSSATSMTLTANSVNGGSTLSGYNCFTIDEGSAQAEFVCGTVSGTTVSSLTRGVDPITATTTNVTLQFAHRRGANVKITDFPLIQIMKHQLSGEDTLDNPLSYTSHPTFSKDTQLVDYKYVNDTAVSGAPNSTESVKGIVELSTQLEMASSTSLGGTGASVVLQSKYATSSRYTTGLFIPITQNDGTLNPSFIATSSGYVYNWGAFNNFNASTTFTATTSISASSVTNGALVVNGLPYKYPSTRGASSTVLMENGSGSLTWNPINPVHYTTTGNSVTTTAGSVSAATTTLITIPAGTLNASSTIQFIGYYQCGNSDTSSHTCTYNVRDSTGISFASGGSTNAGNGAGTQAGAITGFITMNSSLTSQKTSTVGNAVSAPVTMTSLTNDTTTSVNFNNAVTFAIQVTTSSNVGMTAQLSSFSIIVNP